MFVHADGDGKTVIWDFNQGEDIIQLDFEGVSDLQTVLDVAQSVQINDHRLKVVVDENNTLVVYGDVQGISDSDFDFI